MGTKLRHISFIHANDELYTSDEPYSSLLIAEDEMCIFGGRYKSVEPAEITLSANLQCCFLKKMLNSRNINTHETHENDQHEHFPKKLVESTMKRSSQESSILLKTLLFKFHEML